MVDITLSVVLFIPLYYDIKYGIIPNCFILSLFLSGLIINIYLNGAAGIFITIGGFSLGLLIFLVPFLLGGLGAGDVKLVAAIGALKGAYFILWDSFFIAVIGGVISLFVLIKENKLGKVMKLFNKLIYLIPLDDLVKQDEAESFPYGLAIVFGTWVFLLSRALNIWSG